MRFPARIVLFVLTLSMGAFCSPSICLPLTSPSSDHLARLGAYISAYNLKAIQESLNDGSYRGEEGILRIKPEVGRFLGLEVLQTPEYLAAVSLYAEAEALMREAMQTLRTRDAEKTPGEHIEKAARLAVRHNEAIKTAWDNMMIYRSQLSSEADERLKEDICLVQLEKLLQKALADRSFNLREALGGFFNQCRDPAPEEPLHAQNIRFVNFVFDEFLKNTPREEWGTYDLDRYDPGEVERPKAIWKAAAGQAIARFSSDLEMAFEKHGKEGYPMDILLFLALMRQESNFEPLSVSYVGAAGLTQIMPATARALGMTEIFEPAYFKEAGTLLRKERTLRKRTSDLLLEITKENALALAKRARQKMQQSLECKKKREELYSRYRRELLKTGTDDRLDSAKAIRFGLQYFSQMMKIQNGDISLALASYNAGPHRVKQYNGLPPYDETIAFRNRVLGYYREYRIKAEKISNEPASRKNP